VRQQNLEARTLKAARASMVLRTPLFKVLDECGLDAFYADVKVRKGPVLHLLFLTASCRV
jgi:hypothetical protein